MCTRPITISIPASYSDRMRGVFEPSQIQVPCGKCCECMKKKQNSIRFRVLNEAHKRGSMHFVTLTYNNDTLPIGTSLWSIDRESGELSLFGQHCIPSHVPSYVRDFINHDFASIHASKMRSMFVRHPFSDFDSHYDYYLCYAPCHNYNDVKKCFKLARKYYQLLYSKVADFTYLVVPEFGEHFTRRPHFHICLFGCPDEFVKLFSDIWSKGLYRVNAVGRKAKDFPKDYFCHCIPSIYPKIWFREVFRLRGFTDVRKIAALNVDGTSGYMLTANYVGKYVGKGVFEDSLIKDGFITIPRIGISRHFGELPESLVRWHLCQDIFGDYDDQTLKGLSEDTITKITKAVAGRLYHSFSSFDYALPIQFKRQIFRGRFAKSPNEIPSYLKEASLLSQWPASGKIVYSALYYSVSAFVRDKLIQDREEEFRQYIFHHPSKDLYTAVAAFESAKSLALKVREEAAFSKQRAKLQTLKF